LKTDGTKSESLLIEYHPFDLKSATIMLQAKTKEQKNRIKEIFGSTSTWYGDYDDGIHIDDWVSYDKLAELVDYLRSVNKPKKVTLDLSVVAHDMIEPVETWLAYKKEKGKMYKPIGFKNFYKKLCELSGNNPQTAMAIIEESMANNYDGIFPLRNNNNRNYGRETITDKIRRTVEESNQFSQQLADRIGKQADVCDGDDGEVW
jgi:hypothetical protein